MEKGGLYNRGSIMLSKSTKKVDKNASRAVRYTNPYIYNYVIGLRIKVRRRKEAS